jgi:hypothetical protein
LKKAAMPGGGHPAASALALTLILDRNGANN